MLPYQLPVTDGLYVADYGVLHVATPAATATGIVVVNTPEVDPGKDYAWLVDNVVVQNTSTTPTQLLMFIGQPGSTSSSNLAAGSDSGNLDFDDVAGIGLLVQGTEAITFEWTGCSLGAVGAARVQYRKLRQAEQ